MTESIISFAIFAGITGTLLWYILNYEPNYEEMERSLTDKCPKCGKLLYIESGTIHVYRCKFCNFEGIKQPGYMWFVSAIKNRWKYLKEGKYKKALKFWKNDKYKL